MLLKWLNVYGGMMNVNASFPAVPGVRRESLYSLVRAGWTDHLQEGLTQDPDTIITKLLTVPGTRGGGGSEIRMLNVAYKANRDDFKNGMKTSGFQEGGRDDPITRGWGWI